MVAKLALSKLCICAVGGALIGGTAVHVAEKAKPRSKPRIHRLARAPKAEAEPLPCEPIMVQQAGLTVDAPAFTSPMGTSQAPVSLSLPPTPAPRTSVAALVPPGMPGGGLAPFDPGLPDVPGNHLQPAPPSDAVSVAEPVATGILGIGVLGAAATRRRSSPAGGAAG